MTSPLLGKMIELTDPFWYLHCYREIFGDQVYRFIANRQDPLIIDCGANIGMSVIYFKYLYPDARIGCNYLAEGGYHTARPPRSGCGGPLREATA